MIVKGTHAKIKLHQNHDLKKGTFWMRPSLKVRKTHASAEGASGKNRFPRFASKDKHQDPSLVSPPGRKAWGLTNVTL